ncbi:HAD family hydrolase [Ilumatobacter sp.]|uniref:HAD family hydrolase n=2 Tax=Ilumatobacter sp. TaxID=1967498 RepID=UPI0037512E42
MTRLDDFDLIAFDADDTLWQSEDSFNRAELAFFELVRPHCPVGVDVEEALRAVERADLPVSGYGVKAFTISMVRAAMSASNRSVPVEVLEQLVEIGQHMLTEPVRVLNHVPQVLAAVGAEKRIVMITKGDLVHQTRKVTTSGLEHHFSDIEILLEKDPVTYAKIFRRLGVETDRVLMVGNSVKSDILPVLALGGHAVHIPYHTTWELERVDEHDEEFAELASISELPGWLGI